MMNKVAALHAKHEEERKALFASFGGGDSVPAAKRGNGAKKATAARAPREGTSRDKVFAVLGNGGGLSFEDLVAETEVKSSTLRQLLYHMKSKGEILKEGNLWKAPA
jgi:hypothetical protein